MLLGLSLKRQMEGLLFPEYTLSSCPLWPLSLTWDLTWSPVSTGPAIFWGRASALHPAPSPFAPCRTKPAPSQRGTHAFYFAADLTWEESASPQLMTVSPCSRKSHRSYGFPWTRICQIYLPPSDSQHNESFGGRQCVSLWPLGRAGVW